MVLCYLFLVSEFCTTSETEGEVGTVKLVEGPRPLQCGSSVVDLCCLFLMSDFLMTFRFMFVHIIFSSVWVAE